MLRNRRNISVMRNLIIPASIATCAGFGLDLMANILSGRWPTAPHLVYTLLFWSGAFMTAVPLLTWLCSAVLAPRTGIKRRSLKLLLSAVPAMLMVGFIIAIEAASHDSEAIIAAQKREQKLELEKQEAARRWISLSQDMFFDLPSLRPDFNPPIDQRMPQELQQQLWKSEANRNRREANAAINRMKQKYEARVEQARLEMVKFRVGQADDLETHSLFNTGNLLVWEEWAKRLGAEGHKVLGD
jgi:hypothetical protein